MIRELPGGKRGQLLHCPSGRESLTRLADGDLGLDIKRDNGDRVV